MGRHSTPDPGDSADEERPSTNRDDAPRQPPTPPRRHRYLDDDADEEPGDQPGFVERDPRAAASRTPEYTQPDYRQPDYRQPEYTEPEYPEAGYSDAYYDHDVYQPDSAEDGYDEQDEHRYDATYSDDYDDDYGGGYGAGFDGGSDGDDVAASRPGPGGSGSRRPPTPPPSGPQHSGDRDNEWTGSHRAVVAKRRGISVGVIAALVAVVVVVGAFILWRFFGDALSHRSDVAAARCVDGELTVPVVADPTIADQIQKLAGKYNDSASPVGDRCVKVGVKSAETDQVVDGFVNDWNKDLGDKPALWIPASGVSEARLEAVAGAKTVSDSRSLVTSPVVIAARPQLKDALAQQNWANLPGLQTNPTALDGLKLSGWGTLRLALPVSGDGDAAYLAAEAVAAASAPAGSPASAGMGAVNTLMGGQPQLADKKAGTALDALLNAKDPATAPVHAVVTTEQQLFQRAADRSDAKSTVAAWIPPGPTPTADYPTALLAGDWLSQEQITAASEFARFMRKPEQLSELAKAGFRSQGAKPPQSDVTSFAPVSAPLSVGDNALRATLANALSTPAQAPVVTIMLDQSMPTDEGGKSRLANVVAALNARLSALPASAHVGLWTFDGTAGRSEVSRGPLSDQVGGQPRSAALTDKLNGQSASDGGAVSFTTLRLIYTDAMSNFVQGKPNSILVITTGPHTDKSLDGDELQQFVRSTFEPARPVAVNVIDFGSGSGSDRSAWEGVAQTSGGTYQHLSSSASPELTAAITTMLS